MNGVAKRHGEVARHIYPTQQIDSITNGVRPATWAAPSLQALFDRFIPTGATTPRDCGARWRSARFRARGTRAGQARAHRAHRRAAQGAARREAPDPGPRAADDSLQAGRPDLPRPRAAREDRERLRRAAGGGRRKGAPARRRREGGRAPRDGNRARLHRRAARGLRARLRPGVGALLRVGLRSLGQHAGAAARSLRNQRNEGGASTAFPRSASSTAGGSRAGSRG